MAAATAALLAASTSDSTSDSVDSAPTPDQPEAAAPSTPTSAAESRQKLGENQRREQTKSRSHALAAALEAAGKVDEACTLELGLPLPTGVTAADRERARLLLEQMRDLRAQMAISGDLRAQMATSGDLRAQMHQAPQASAPVNGEEEEAAAAAARAPASRPRTIH